MLSAEDIDRIDASGTVFGRGGLERYYGESWKTDSSAIVKDESRNVRFLTSDVAILDVDNVITRSSGTAKNHATFVYVKKERRVDIGCSTGDPEAIGTDAGGDAGENAHNDDRHEHQPPNMRCSRRAAHERPGLSRRNDPARLAAERHLVDMAVICQVSRTFPVKAK